jgi:flagellar protein FliL
MTMADAHAAQGKPSPAATPKKKGKGLLIVLIVVLVLAAGGGGAAFYFWKANAAPAGDASAENRAKPEASGLVTLEPFLVNLADEGGHAYLRVSLKLLVTNEEQVALFEGKAVIKSMVRSAILETLATQTAERLVTPEGKAALKETITKHIAALKQPIDVHDVLFSDFVVQY